MIFRTHCFEIPSLDAHIAFGTPVFPKSEPFQPPEPRQAPLLSGILAGVVGGTAMQYTRCQVLNSPFAVTA
jgi:hypothetical protein